MMLNKLKRRIITIFLIVCIVISGNIYPMDVKASESIAEKSDIYRQDVKTKTNDETDNDANRSENNVIVGVPKPNILYTSGEDEQKYKAIKKVWDFIQLVDPNAFETYDNMNGLSDEQKAELKNVAVNEIKDCTTDYQKAKALYNYVADNIYYDYAYYNGQSQTVYWHPYEVYEYKRTVCSGYAEFYATLCGLVGIHTMELIGENHEYNAVYCKEEGRWIFVDSTWGSRNSYYIDEQQNVVWNKGSVSDAYFDSSIEFISNLTNHEVYEVSHIYYKNAEYDLHASAITDSWYNTKDWSLEITENINNMVAIIYDIPVKVIGEGTCLDKNIEIIDLSKYPYRQIEKIGQSAFSNLINLKKVILSSSVTSIEEHAFSGCEGLESINLQDCQKLDYIGRFTFKECKKIKNIELPSSIKSIGEYSFYNCEELESINLQGCLNLDTIGNGVFENCVSIKKIELPKSIRKIWDSAFSGCEGMEDINLQDCTNLNEIGTFAFDCCRKLQKIELPDSITKIGYRIFSYCQSVEKIKFGENVADIGECAFSGCENIKEIDLPDAIETIENDAFMNCKTLENVKFGSNLTKIEDGAFYGCSSIEEIKLPDTVKIIGKDAFSCCDALKNIEFGNNLTDMGYGAFSMCRNLEKIVLPDSLVSIGENAFRWCYSLDEVKFGKKITSIGEGAFEGCINIESIDLSNTNLVSIEKRAFSNDRRVKIIKLPSSLRSIDDNAFTDTYMLKILYLPMKKIEIGKDVISITDKERCDDRPVVVVSNMTDDELQGLKCNTRSFVIGKYAYTINYDGNGKMGGTMESDVAAGGTDYCLLKCEFYKECSNFIGWNTKKDGTGQQYDDMANVNSLAGDGESITLYAQWSKSGDLDGDSKVTTKDLMILLYGVSGRNQLTELQQKSADIDRDGKVTVSDLTRLLYYVSGRNSYL